MNRLKPAIQVAIISALTEGCSVRSVERMTGVHRDSIIRLMVRVGSGCASMMDASLRGLRCRHVQVDELWAYVGKKQRRLTPEDDQREVGDFWTFVALDTDSKLVPSYLVGKRDAASTNAFVADLASRVDGRIQLSSDAMGAYVDAVERAFGPAIDYGRIVKHFEATPVGPGRYSPPEVVSVTTEAISGSPEGICTSHVERLNLTVRMQQRRFTRLTSGFSKKVENLRAAVSLHFGWYNFVRVHGTTRVTPAMAAGVESRPWTMAELVDLGGWT